MIRLAPLLLTFLIYSCVTSKSIKHYASQNNLAIKEVEAVNFFNGTIEVQELKKKSIKEPFYLLYDHDTLKFLSNSKRITNNDFIYKISSKSDSNLTFYRSSRLVRYFTVDTLSFSPNYAIDKRCLYDESKLVRVEINQYTFKNDSLFTASHFYNNDLSQAPSIHGGRSFFEGKATQFGDLLYNYSHNKWTLTKSLF